MLPTNSGSFQSENPMSNSSTQDQKTRTASRKPITLFILSRGSMALAGFLFILIIGGIWRLRSFIQNELVPLAQQNLTNTLNRPVQLGEVKEFSLTGVRFATSAIPPTPTDIDRATIESVDVGFDPWQLVFNRQLKLDVTLINPDIYIQQDNQGRWITTTIAPPTKLGIIKTNLDKLRVRNGKLILVGNQKEREGQATANQRRNINSPVTSKRSPIPVVFSNIYGTAQLIENNRRIEFDLAGKPENGGKIYLQGNIRARANLEGNIRVKTQDLLAPDISRLIQLPINLQAGRVSGDLQIQLTPNQQPLLDGNAALQAVTLQIPTVPQLLGNTQGNVKFQGLVIELDNIVSNYGKIPLIGQGVIDRKKGFNLTASVNAVSFKDALETLKLQSPFSVSGVVKADLKILGDLNKPMLLGNVSNINNAKIDQVYFEKLSSRFELLTHDSLLTLRDIQGKTTLGGEVTGGGKIELGKVPQVNVNLTAKNVPGDAIAQLYNDHINSKFTIGNVSGTAKITGAGSNLQTFLKWQAPQATYAATGETIINSNFTVDFHNVAVNIGGKIVQGYGSYNPESWQAIAQASDVKLTPFLLTPFVKEQPLKNLSLGNAAFNGKLVISGNSDNFKITNIRPENATINIAGGKVAISRLQLEDKKFIADLIAKDVQLGRIFKESPPILNYPIGGKFTIAGNTENFDLNNFAATGEGSLKVGKGKITANNIQVSSGRYQAQVAIKNVAVEKLVDVPPQVQGRLVGEFNVTGSVASFQPETIQATGQGKLNLAGGTVTASNIQVANGHYQTIVNSSGVELNQLHQQLSGKFASQLQVTGIVGSEKLGDIRATGQVQFSQGILGINSRLNALVSWNGQQLTIPQARTTNLNASGYIVADARQPGIPEITQLNLNVQAQNYDLKELPLQLPNGVNVGGKADFKGQITGKITAPNVIGALGLRNLQIQKLGFEPLLTGKINLVSGQGLNLDIAGKKDRLTVQLNANNQISAFLLQWQQGLATGQSQGDNLAVKINDFPLEVLSLNLNFNLPSNPILGKSTLAGLLTGDLQINQKTLFTRGNIAIAQPQIGRIKGDRFTTQLNYNNNLITLTNSEFINDQSRYLFDANIKATPQGPQVKAKININQGKIQDLLTVAQIFELQDLQRGLTPATYSTAAALTTKPQGLPNQPLFNQIQLLAEIDALLAAEKQNRIESKPIPDLQELKGNFNGDITINTATKNGLTAEFNLQGKNFTWGREIEPSRFYSAEKFIAKGNFEKGVLRLQPLRIEYKDRLISFTGNVGGTEQSGKLIIEEFPIQLLNNFIKIPIGISGNLNIDAGIAGSIANPKARGSLKITDGKLNQKSIESANASFNYTDGRLQFNSQVIGVGNEPVNITGDIPYKLPFAYVKPDNNQISLDVKVKDEGLGLLNLFTNQITFENGTGAVELFVKGTRQQPLVDGTAFIDNATFTAQGLQGKLTNVSGKAKFDFNKVLVENLQGRFSNGKVEADGEIPIFDSQNIQINNPLSVKLKQLVLSLKGLYQGSASGNLAITGSVLQPAIGGEIELSNGQIFLDDSDTSILSKTNPNLSIIAINKQNKMSNIEGDITTLDNLLIKLGRNVQITRLPIFNFLASGELNVTGSLNNPIPAGTIKLTKGGVNLFTTQFNLAGNYKHTATFRVSRPRDPELDIKLFAKVLDGIQTIDLNRQIYTGLSELETVRVEAIVKGLASQINKNLELKSSPSRSQTEIITLLGGGFVDTQGRGDTTLGLINIAGSAVFNNLQAAFNQIGDTFGLSELRIFPTILSDKPEAGKNNSSLELALEAGVDISNKFSFSTIKILTASDPLQWGINYRINEDFRVRASTNLTDDSRAVIEFERRF